MGAAKHPADASAANDADGFAVQVEADEIIEPEIVAAQLLIGLAQAAIEGLSRNNIHAHDVQHGSVQRRQQRTEPEQPGQRREEQHQHRGGHKAGGQGQLLARPASKKPPLRTHQRENGGGRKHQLDKPAGLKQAFVGLKYQQQH